MPTYIDTATTHYLPPTTHYLGGTKGVHTYTHERPDYKYTHIYIYKHTWFLDRAGA